MRPLGYFDLKTGEVLEQTNLYAIRPQRQNGFGKRWLAVAQDTGGIDLAMMHKQLGVAGYAALWYVIGIADFNNRVVFTKKDAAEKLGFLPSAFSRAFRRLLDANLVRETEKVSGAQHYIVNPEVVWRGKSIDHHAALKAWREGEKS